MVLFRCDLCSSVQGTDRVCRKCGDREFEQIDAVDYWDAEEDS